ncbi:MAG: ferritin family protein [Sedimentisphaerales bacterium]|nr:ferritin family protein [Sedimentisphaerales bacterium]
MQDFDSIDEILDFAIREEEEAHQFYLDLAGKMESRQMKLVFEDMASEEKKHKEKLLEMKKNKHMLDQSADRPFIKLSDYAVDEVEMEPLGRGDSAIQQAFVLAMQKEKAAFRMYSDLADLTQNEHYRTVWENLAMEESKHKLKLEIEYEDHFMAEN